MEQQTMEISDETTPVCKVEKHNPTQNRIRFKIMPVTIAKQIPVTLNSPNVIASPDVPTINIIAKSHIVFLLLKSISVRLRYCIADAPIIP